MSKCQPPPEAVRLVTTGWTDTLLICRKCSKKLRKGGFGPGGRKTLRQAARAVLRASQRRGQIGIIEVGCVGICPKRGVTTARASQPGVICVVPAGYPVEALLG